MEVLAYDDEAYGEMRNVEGVTRFVEVKLAPRVLLLPVGRFASSAADAHGAIDALTRAVRADPNDPAMHKLLATQLQRAQTSPDASPLDTLLPLVDLGVQGSYNFVAGSSASEAFEWTQAGVHITFILDES